MVTEDYVSFETAKLLKEKEFVELTNAYYDENGQYFVTPNPYIPKGYPNLNSFILCPTYQMAMKWLRVVHNIFIQIELYSKHGDYCFEVFKNTHRLIVEKDEVYNTPEETCEDALKYVLENLI